MSEQFTRDLADEVGQEVIRGLLATGTANRVARGVNPRSAVIETIRDDILSDASPFMHAARTVAQRLGPRVVRLGPTVAATSLAALMRRWNLADAIMPGDNGPIASLLRTIARGLPTATIGTGLAVGDMVVNWVNGVVDDPAKDPADRNGQLDRVIRTMLLPGRVFVAAIDDAGQIRRYDDGTPMVNDPAWVQAYDMWRRSNPTRRESRGRGRNANQVNVPGQPFPWDPVPMDQAVQALEAMHVNRVDLEEIRRVLGGNNTSWAAQISDGSWLVLDAMIFESLNQGLRGRFAVDFQEDLAANSVDPTLINARLARFVPLVQVVRGVPTFTDPRAYRAATRVVDTFNKTELVAGNKALRAVLDAYDAARDRGWNPVAAGMWAFALSTPIWGSALLLVAAFLLGAWMFLSGLGTPAGGTVSFMGTTVPGAAKAFVNMFVGGFLVFATTWPLPIWEKLLNAIPFLGNNRPEWLTSIGRKIGVSALVMGGMCAFAAWLGIDVWYRLLIPMSSFIGVGVMLGLADAGRREMVKAIYANNSKYILAFFVTAPLALAFVGGMIHAKYGVFVTGLDLAESFLLWLKGIVLGSKWLSAAIVFAFGCVAAIVAYRKSSKIVVHRGVAVRIANPKVPWLSFCFAGVMAMLLAFIFLAEPAEKATLFDFSSKVSVTDVTTEDAQTGAKMRDRRVEYDDGTVTTLHKGTVMTNVPTKTAAAPKQRPVDCSKPLPVDVRRRLCQ